MKLNGTIGSCYAPLRCRVCVRYRVACISIDWPFYKLHDEFIQHPDWWLKSGPKDPEGGGKVCRTNGDGTFPNHTDMLVFDFAQQAVRDFWSSECLNMTQTGFVDGCFSDRSPMSNSDMSAPCDAGPAFAAGHVAVLQELQKELGNGAAKRPHPPPPPPPTSTKNKKKSLNNNLKRQRHKKNRRRSKRDY